MISLSDRGHGLHDALEFGGDEFRENRRGRPAFGGVVVEPYRLPL
jgi:hypothetical protein